MLGGGREIGGENPPYLFYLGKQKFGESLAEGKKLFRLVPRRFFAWQRSKNSCLNFTLAEQAGYSLIVVQSN